MDLGLAMKKHTHEVVDVEETQENQFFVLDVPDLRVQIYSILENFILGYKILNVSVHK